MRSFQHNDVSLAFYDSATRGIPLVLVHGFPLYHSMWRHQLLALSKSARVIAPDLRGYGGSQRGEGPLSISLFAEDLLALLDHLQLEKVVLGGLSMGGYVIQELLSLAPERVAGLLLCDTRSEADTPEEASKREAAIQKITSEGKNEFIEGMVERLLSPSNRKDTTLSTIVREMASATSPGLLCDTLQALLNRRDTTHILAKCTVPSLIIVGKEDAITPPSFAHRMASALKDGEVFEVEGAGHMAPLEAPLLVNERIEQFLARCAG